MNALNNTLEFYKTQLEALEKSHETDIMDFINLDEDIMEDFFGDWTKREVELYDYLFETTATLQKAKKIIEHHQDLQELTKKEPHNIDLEFEQDQEAHAEVTLELEEGKDKTQEEENIKLQKKSEETGLLKNGNKILITEKNRGEILYFLSYNFLS